VVSKKRFSPKISTQIISNLPQFISRGAQCPPSLTLMPSGVAKGEGTSGGKRPGAQALGAHQHTFCSHLKTRFKQKFRPKYA